MRVFMLAVAVLAVLAVGVFGAVRTAEAIPGRYYGVVTVDGTPVQRPGALASVVVTAEVNGKDCSSVIGFSGDPGNVNYNIDVTSDSEVSGCAKPNDVVFFKIGTRYAAESSCFNPGAFTQLNLTISGAAAKPAPNPACAGTVAPTPTPTPAPTTAPTPAPTQAPSAQPFGLSILDMNQPCIPVSGQNGCDATRLALWNGDQAAWRARFQSENRAAPTADDVFVATLTFRVDAGDPATIAAIAQAVGWPHVRINAVRFRGRAANETDEWVEVKNFGGAAQDMSGWSVRVPGTNVSWNFADGFSLQPGQACKFYTGDPGADPCPGSRNVATSGILPNDQGVVELWVNFLDLRAIRATYAADPNNQPPPPNLQGFSQ